MHTDKQAHRFGVLFDGSEIAVRVLMKAIAMKADHDGLSVITVLEQGVDEDRVKSSIAQIAGGVEHDVVILHPQLNQRVKDRVN